jgi:hypothetical protein
VPPSPSLSTLLDKFWTRFAFSFEAQHITPYPCPDSLSVWLGGYPAPGDDISRAVDGAVDAVDLDIEGAEIGVVGRDGPLSTRREDSALMRYLVNRVQASLPPPITTLDVPKADARQTLGFGLGKRRNGGMGTWLGGKKHYSFWRCRR